MLYFARFNKIQIFLIWIVALSKCQEEPIHSGLSAVFPRGLNETEYLEEKLTMGVEIDPSFVPIASSDDGFDSSPGCPRFEVL